MSLDRDKLQAMKRDADERLATLRSQPPPTLPTIEKPTLPTRPTIERPTIEDPRVLQLRARRRRRRREVAAVVVLLILVALLSRWCTCEPAPVEPEPVPELICPAAPECPTGPAKKPSTAKPKRKPSKGTAPSQDRDLLAVPTTRSPSWLAALRLQVTARSLPLARCFNGVEKPGALRWTTTVTPSNGRVADSLLDPVLGAVALTRAQEQCVLGVLSGTPFRLDVAASDPGGDVGTRVSLILEF